MFSSLHKPVLLDAVCDIFDSLQLPHPTVVDATLGLGGHAGVLMEKMRKGKYIGFDRDSENLLQAQKHLQPLAPSVEKYYISESFSSLQEGLDSLAIEAADVILYDLGVSSVHLDSSERGFSFRFDGPLDMRFDRTRGKTAKDLVMSLSPTELARIFTAYGEEKKSWFIACALEKARKIDTIDTTYKLLEIIKSSSFDPKSPLRVFQALRIAVNDEFAHIEDSLTQALSLLRPGGVLMVITFHSVEDRLVKQFFTPYLEDTIDPVTGQIREKSHFRKYTKKPIIPTEEEISLNPRSRSAKMRIIQKIVH